ncbi:uncharacterized protein LOC112081541 [Eutrema salsugineum]|uniref:uncharacterized protein LOC112081541 n=1 Tax=Eutrema salsugineum TaxID=72664 RepID=UPI000CED10B2|nr:uncharacterized protein LOC112081541 [Eutrema salsugineum]
MRKPVGYMSQVKTCGNNDQFYDDFRPFVNLDRFVSVIIAAESSRSTNGKSKDKAVEVRRKSPFKFFSFFAELPDYLQHLQDVWNASMPSCSSLLKLKAEKGFCKGLNRRRFSDIQRHTAKAFADLEHIQAELFFYLSGSLFTRKEAHESWSIFAKAEETLFSKNSAFGGLRRVMLIPVSSIEWLKLGKLAMLLITSVPRLGIGYPIWRWLKTWWLTTTELASLFAVIPTAEDIRSVVFALPRGKAPGPDGFSVEFFTSGWSMVGSDLILAVQEFFRSSCSLKKFNGTTLTLILKFPGADKLSDFRPIACCNIFFKVISRILGLRLKMFSSKVVQRNQVGFMDGWLLCENVLLVSERVSDFHKDGPTTQGCLQIHLSKAYDNLHWKFIINILKAFELPDIFLDL